MSLKELDASGFSGLISIRYAGPPGSHCGHWCKYDVPRSEVAAEVAAMVADGAEEGRIVFNEGAPDDAIVIQGELWNGLNEASRGPMSGAYWMRYSRVKEKMRIALGRSVRFSEGLQSLMLLRSAMTPSSWADFELVMDRWPEHVIEFSVFSRCLGDVPGRNALVWEVRQY